MSPALAGMLLALLYGKHRIETFDNCPT